jgi:hypothetical protein
MTSAKRFAVGFGIALVALLGSVSAAQAQYAPPPPYYPPPPPPPPRGVYRSGLVLGFGVGGGAITASDCGDVCGGAIVGEFHIGGMINPRMAVLFDVFGADHPWSDPAGDSHSTTNSFWMGALQFWPNDILWVKGGIGVGHIQVTNDSALLVSGDETGLGLMGAVGFEVVQSYNFALDIQGRIAHGFYSQGGDANNLAVLVGFNWY